MRKVFFTVFLFFLLMPFVAQASSCESVRKAIAKKIIKNGVPKSRFKLDIVPNDLVPEQKGTQVVGHCGNETQKIVYTRFTDSEETYPLSSKLKKLEELKK